MSFLDFLVMTLAGSAVVDVWFRGSIFAPLRALIQLKQDEFVEDFDSSATVDENVDTQPLGPFLQLVDRVLPSFFVELLACHFCLSHHTPYILALLFFLPTVIFPDGGDTFMFLCKLPVYSLAATRCGNIINSFLPENAKYQ